jgi:alcohol dehydrogenase
MKDFVFRLPTKVIFGPGKAREIGNICLGMGAAKVFVITGPNIGKSELFEGLKASIEASGVECAAFSGTTADPSAELADEVAAVVRASKADLLIALGGGSPIDLAKAVSLLQTHEGSVRDYLFGGGKAVTKPVMPLIAIPTTAGTGSEVTAAAVITDSQNRIKLSVTHENLIPKLALADPMLHVSMPPLITASTGMDALTHAIESYTSLNAEPISDALGLRAIKLIGENLRTAVADGQNLEARANMAIAALLAGAAFANGGLGVVHGIAQALGGLHHTAHGIANGVILPYAMRRNCVGNLKKFKDIAVALGERTDGLGERDAALASVRAVRALLSDIQAPATLKEIGIGREDFGPVIEGTMGFRLLAINPCKLSERDVEGILEEALSGEMRI